MKRCLKCLTTFRDVGWRCPRCGIEPSAIDGIVAFAPELAEANDEYPPDVFEDLVAANPDNYWRVARNRLFTWACSRYFPGAKSFFEIGSGTGVILSAFRRAFPRLDLSGSEIYADGLRAVGERVPGATLHQLDARNLPFEEEFDLIGAFDVIEHVDDDEAVLREICRATRTGGGIMISVPQHRFLWSQRDVALCHKRRYTRDELVGKVRGAGLEPFRVTSFVSLPFPLMVLSAMRNRRAREGYDPFAELKVNRLVDRALSAALATEFRLIRGGFDFPFGGSLFVCARKSGETGGVAAGVR